MTGEGVGAGLYVHVPFCSFVCPYCDYAVQRLERGAEDPWLAALLAEAEMRGEWRQPFDSIYLGGGTPSILGPERLARLIDGLRVLLPMAADVRLHMEANPEDVDAASLAAWRDLGVSFLSLGVQSFVDRELRFLGRRHDAAEARRALELALESGIEVISVDLIFGLPDQRACDLRASLVAATPPGVDHLSCYQLTVKPGTLFSRRAELGRLTEISTDLQGDLYLMTHEVLAERGLHAYEVSNFARSENARSRHNDKYWRHVPYLGLGPGAHSFADKERFWNLAEESSWREALRAGKLPEAGRESLSAGDLLVEAIMLGCRTAEGIDLDRLEREFGYELSLDARAKLRAFLADGLLAQDGPNLRPSPAGMAVADAIAADLAPGR